VSSPKVKEAVDCFSANRSKYADLANKVESVVKELLDSKKINYHSISSRVKSIDSYARKASKDEYKNPVSEIFDMAGIRVITYTDSDAKEVTDIVKETFDIDPKLSIDKTTELGVDRMGYRSIHCVGTLGKNRLGLPENSTFKGMYFEIQVRSILQHAWAEFEHDRNYKFTGVLPHNIKRTLSLLAGTLELVDKEFDNLSEEIDLYVTDVSKRAALGDLSIPVNSKSLVTYMSRKFNGLIALGLEPTLADDTIVIEELRIMGIDSLEQLENIIPKDFAETEAKYLSGNYPISFLGILRDIMIVHDAETYFRKAWRKRWSGIDRDTHYLYKAYGVDIQKYAEQYDLDLF
jgi:putative GTP pyrophosphokinase